MTTEQLERLWFALSEAIAAVGPEREAVFLAKLALLLAHDLDDPDRVAALIEDAKQNL
jgi:hypothetical protein